MTRVYIQPALKKKIDKAANKFTFRSSILRELIEHQLLVSKGKGGSLKVVRHYVNSKGVCPYDELWKEVRPAVDKACSKLISKGKPKEAAVLRRKAHDVYRGIIDEKIYNYTIKTLYNKLT